MEIVTGVILGISTLLFVGPVFFYLIESTLLYGKKAGIISATAIIIGDIIYVILILKGFSTYFNDTTFQKWFAVFGGIILLTLGFSYIFKPKKIEQKQWILRNKDFLSIGIKAFLLNFANPFVALVWVGFLTYNQSKFNSQIAISISLAATLSIIFLTDILKVFLASTIKKTLQPKSFKKTQKVLGFLLIVFALRLFFTVI